MTSVCFRPVVIKQKPIQVHLLYRFLFHSTALPSPFPLHENHNFLSPLFLKCASICHNDGVFEEEAGVSSPNSTVSSVRGKQTTKSNIVLSNCGKNPSFFPSFCVFPCTEFKLRYASFLTYDLH
ncbi:hypothetical protein QL285_007431 [Trifolium repens]|nr:hypothetical protein QL285_007431 [Trifolium repens]